MEICQCCGKPKRPKGQIVAEAGGSITSPPFLDADTGARVVRRDRQVVSNSYAEPNLVPDHPGSGRTYGTTPGQLGAMKEGSIGGSITSPPYAESDPSASHAQGTSSKNPKSKNYRPVAERDWQERETPRDYGQTPGQIGAVTSPPYADALGNTKSGSDWSKQADAERRANPEKPHGYDGGGYGTVTSPPFTDAQSGGGILKNGYQGRPDLPSDFLDKRHYTDKNASTDPANIARLPIGSVTSSPYEGTELLHIKGTMSDAHRKMGIVGHRNQDDGYGESHGQVGQTSGETYWSACRTIYEQLYDLFSPGSHAAIVVKSFVRNKKIVPLPQMTLDLLIDIGFTPVLWVDAKLTGEALEPSMLAEVPDYQRKKSSFFRRLYEAKYPENRIDAEVVLVVCKR